MGTGTRSTGAERRMGTLIAVVDDDASVQRSLGRLLTSYGFQVETFGSAEEFLQSGRLSKTACLVLDVRLPGMNGLDLESGLRAVEPAVPIIFITAHGGDAIRDRALRGGVVDVLSKPVDQDALLSAIRSALGPHHAEPNLG
jgi:FixJ family two-component response regulator